MWAAASRGEGGARWRKTWPWRGRRCGSGLECVGGWSGHGGALACGADADLGDGVAWPGGGGWIGEKNN